MICKMTEKINQFSKTERKTNEKRMDEYKERHMIKAA